MDQRNPRPLKLAHAARTVAAATQLERHVLDGRTSLDDELQKYMRGRKAMGGNDRKVLATAVYALARNRDLCHRALDPLGPTSGDFLRLALLDAARDGEGRAELAASFDPRVERALAALDELRAACEKTIEERGQAAPDGEARDALALLHSVPPWWLERGPWATTAEAHTELQALRHPAATILRVQIHRATRDEAVARLRGQGLAAQPTELSPWGVVLEGRPPLAVIHAYKDGTVEVQDEGSQLACCLCAPSSGQRILDLCAGGGGKTLALAAAAGPGTLVVAHDKDQRRLADTAVRARRAGLHAVTILPGRPEVERLGPYDMVLVDAPCTSTGTLRRAPDFAWRWRAEDLDRLAATQAGILDEAAPLVRAGGHLIYATCSLLEPEGGAQARAFLERHPDFAYAPPGEHALHAPLKALAGGDEPRGAFRLPAGAPGYSGDSFFMARFVRRA